MAAEDWQEQLRPLLEAFRDPLEQPIYHYTSAEGFRGIVDSGEIWLTNAAFVNDTTEFRLFWEQAVPVLKQERRPNEWIKKHLEDYGPSGNDVYYIASFSEQEDSLQQYRAYGSICIGFDPHRMNRSGFNLYRCVYKIDAITRWMREKGAVLGWDECEDTVKEAAASHLVFAAEAKYKSEHYRSEREVRLVSLSDYTWAYPDSHQMYARQMPIHFRGHPAHKIPLPYVKFFIPADKWPET